MSRPTKEEMAAKELAAKEKADELAKKNSAELDEMCIRDRHRIV